MFSSRFSLQLSGVKCVKCQEKWHVFMIEVKQKVQRGLLSAVTEDSTLVQYVVGGHFVWSFL